MKKLLALLTIPLMVWSCSEPQEKETTVTEEVVIEETIETQEVLNFYGEKITTENAIASTELMAMLDGKDSVNIKVEGTINACCAKKGCWMDVDLGNGESMIVKFKDYEFFVPKNAAGQTAVMEGIAKMEVQTVEWLQHKAEDAGQSEEEIAAITEPEVSVSFMANGVIIKGEVPAEEVEEKEIVTENTEA